MGSAVMLHRVGARNPPSRRRPLKPGNGGKKNSAMFIWGEIQMRIAMMGTRGVPATYGGFETAIEEVGARLVQRGHEVVVYCRDTGAKLARQENHLGMQLVHLPAIRSKSLETLSHSALSAVHLATHRTDVALVFNAANAVWLPILRAARIPVATHVDGLEWKRAKWGPVGKRYYRTCERLAVAWSEALISDAQGIADYYQSKFNSDSYLITYGAPDCRDVGSDSLANLELKPGTYHLVVARFEPENHVHLIVEGHRRSGSKKPLVIVGSSPYSDAYTAQLKEQASAQVQFLGGVWDQKLLNQLYANCYLYWHGHSVGGTNPSLLRALGAGAPVAGFDVSFNREVAGLAGRYFADAAEASALFTELEAHPRTVKQLRDATTAEAQRYDWEIVADGYEKLCQDLYTTSAKRKGTVSKLPDHQRTNTT